MSQVWIIVLIVGIALIAIAGIVFASLLFWRRTVRRYLLGLVGKREDVRAAYQTVENLVTSLANVNDGELVAFALDAAADDRRSLQDIAERMAILAEELATMPLPKRLWSVADDLYDAAGELASQAGALTGQEGVSALDALAAIKLARVRTPFDVAAQQLMALASQYGVDDADFYGGGLYI